MNVGDVIHDVIALTAPAGSNTKALIAPERQTTQKVVPTNAELYSAK